jgi:glucosamine--fructose-6-phosphate aminotransferase (isomerizing)
MTYEKYHTFKEVMRQPDTWQLIYDEIIEDKNFDYNIFKDSYDEIILFGCGSSYNLSQSAAFLTRYLSKLSKNITSLAIPGAELLLNTDLYFKENKKYLVVGFSRSGETTESVDVLKRIKDYKNVKSYAFSCKEGSTFAKLADESYICRNAVEKSIVMTESFSSMLFAYCAIFAGLMKNTDVLEDLKKLIVFVREKLPVIAAYTSQYIDKNSFDSYFVLGSDFNYGLALEADLKMKEMSQVPSYSYHLYEFSHGPKSLLNENSLCLVLTPNKNLIKYEIKLKEYSELKTRMLIIGIREIKNLQNNQISYFLQTESFNKDIVKSFINIPVFQFLAFFKTLKNGLNPDIPRNLSYTVKI